MFCMAHLSTFGDEFWERLMNSKPRLAGAGRWPQTALVGIVTVTSLSLAGLLRADELHCSASNAEQARALGNQLFNAGLYESAGRCYEAAREYALANRAFLDAVVPESRATEAHLSDQRNEAKKLARQVERAFTSEH